jgi:hypothetical protein
MTRRMRYVGGPLDGRRENLYEELDAEVDGEVLERMARIPPHWISTEHGAYLLSGSSEDGSEWLYSFRELPADERFADGPVSAVGDGRAEDRRRPLWARAPSTSPRPGRADR